MINRFCGRLILGNKEFFMKNKILLAIMPATLILTLTLASCGGGGGGGTSADNTPKQTPSQGSSVSYAGMKDGKAYLLEITQKAVKSVRYVAAAGDDYTFAVLTIADGDIKMSAGTVSTAGATLKLKPSNSDTSFDVSISGNGISEIKETVTFDDDSKETITVSSLSSVSQDTALNMTWLEDEDDWALTFSNGNYIWYHCCPV